MTRTSKKQLAEQVVRILSGGNITSDNELQIKEVALYVNQAFGSIVRNRMFQNRNSGDDYFNGAYIYSFKDVPVVKDNDLDIYYAEMPASTIDVPNDMGVHFVGYMKDQTNPFIRVPNGFLGVSRGLRASWLEGQAGYYVDGKNIFIVNYKDDEVPCKLLIKLLVAYGDIDDCDELFMPLDIQDEVIAKALQLYGAAGGVKKDVVNDNIK